MIRRTVDLVAAVVALVVLAVPLAAIALAVRLDSPGSPFYGGVRVGKGGRPFRMWKLRTMIEDADRVGGGITGRNDARITRLGRFLRATKLDELPQFFNLLTGEMTLVGPRAEVPHIVEHYTDAQREVLSVKPGLTGPGQLYYTTDQQGELPDGVSADEYYVEHLLGPKLRIDIDYIRRRSFATDAKIVLETVAYMLRSVTRRDAASAAG